MKIDAGEVRKVATLARLALSEQEVERMASQLSAILTYVDKLGELDTTGVEPTSHVIPLAQPLREDVAGEPMAHGEALANAPAHDEAAFVVPRVL